MKCLTETALVDLAILMVAHVEGSARTTRMVEHVKSCESCSAQYEGHLKLAKSVRSILRDTENQNESDKCLSENALAEFVDGKMPDEERDAALHHLARCQLCIVQLSELVACVEEFAPSVWTYVFERAKEGLELALHPKEGFSQISNTPAVVLKAEPTEGKVYSWTQETEGCMVRFDLQEAESGLHSLQISVSRADGPTDVPTDVPTDMWRLMVCADGNILQAQPIPESGVCQLNDLAPDAYTLEIISSDSATYTFEITI